MPGPDLAGSAVDSEVRLFTGPGLAGTRAGVRLWPASPGAGEVERFVAVATGPEAVCAAWPDGDGLQVRCFNAGVAIEFCGHGLLASACARARSGPVPAWLETGARRFGVTRDGDLWWLHCSRLPARAADPAVAAGWFDRRPEAAATVGDDRGYWILRWPEGFALSELRPRLERMARETTRAVIAICKAPATDPCDIRLRYFAPRYGNDEDSVTGSACAVVAGYWQQSVLTVHQCSPRGGLVHVRVEGDRVSIGGHIDDPIPWQAVAEEVTDDRDSTG